MSKPLGPAPPVPADLVGPVSLAEALACGCGEVRLAVSTPGGDYVAIQARGRVLVRRVCRMSGQSGSVLGSGEWIEPAALAPSLGWRPA